MLRVDVVFNLRQALRAFCIFRSKKNITKQQLTEYDSIRSCLQQTLLCADIIRETK